MTKEKYHKTVLTWGILLTILQGIILIVYITGNPITTVSSLIVLTLVILFFVLSKKEITAGPIIGIILGGFYIISLDIISIVIGIFLIIDCSKLIQYLKGSNIPEENKKEEIEQ